jgi:hypothetical protein
MYMCDKTAGLLPSQLPREKGYPSNAANAHQMKLSPSVPFQLNISSPDGVTEVVGPTLLPIPSPSGTKTLV